MRESYLAAVERNGVCEPGYASEPYEAAWATEAIFFIRILDGSDASKMRFGVDISPDGIRWVSEGSTGGFQAGEDLAFVRVANFGSWLRIRRLDSDGGSAKVIVYLNLK
jgi:hypothetical protein